MTDASTSNLPPAAAPEPPAKQPAPPPAMQWPDFLRNHPPDGPPVKVSGGCKWETTKNPATPQFPLGRDVSTFTLSQASIELYCSHQRCNGDMTFDMQNHIPCGTGTADRFTQGFFAAYSCRHCRVTGALYCVLFIANEASRSGTTIMEAVKLGEWPQFGEKMPDRALDLVGPPGSVNRRLFLQGRKSENRGLGIGALTYYRRVVENQKAHIVGEILRVAKILNAPADIIARLATAQTAWRFQDAVDTIKDAIPEALKIKGHNPLVLLHGPLSEGVHDLTDAQCLQRAQDIRVVLTKLAVGITNALRDESELHESVSRLLKPAGAPPSQEPKAEG